MIKKITDVITTGVSAIMGHELIHVLQFKFIYGIPLSDIIIGFDFPIGIFTTIVYSIPVMPWYHVVMLEIPAYMWSFYVIFQYMRPKKEDK